MQHRVCYDTKPETKQIPKFKLSSTKTILTVMRLTCSSCTSGATTLRYGFQFKSKAQARRQLINHVYSTLLLANVLSRFWAIVTCLMQLMPIFCRLDDVGIKVSLTIKLQSKTAWPAEHSGKLLTHCPWIVLKELKNFAARVWLIIS